MAAGSNKKPKYPHWKQVVLDQFKVIMQHPDFYEDMQKVYDILHASDKMSMAELLHDMKVTAGQEKGIPRDALVNVNLTRLIHKYEVSGGMHELFKRLLIIMAYAEEDGIDIRDVNEESLLDDLAHGLTFPPLFLVCPEDGSVLLSDDAPHNLEVYNAFLRSVGRKRVYIELTANVNQDDIIDYVKQNYKQIEKKLDLVAPNRIRRATSKPQYKRDYKIIGLYKEYVANPEYHRKVYQAIYDEMHIGHKRTDPTIDTIQAVVKHYKKQKRSWDVLLD